MGALKTTITKVFTFDCAHHLNEYEGKCKNIHGHTYKLEVTVKGPVQKNGLVMDFHDLDAVVENEILQTIDHKYLNEIFDFNPTCENIGAWIWDEADKRMAHGVTLERIVLWETPTSFVTIEKE